MPSPVAYMYTQINLRRGISLLGGHLIPSHCLGTVFGNAATSGIHDTQIELRRGISLLGGHPIPIALPRHRFRECLHRSDIHDDLD